MKSALASMEQSEGADQVYGLAMASVPAVLFTAHPLSSALRPPRGGAGARPGAAAGGAAGRGPRALHQGRDRGAARRGPARRRPFLPALRYGVLATAGGGWEGIFKSSPAPHDTASWIIRALQSQPQPQDWGRQRCTGVPLFALGLFRSANQSVLPWSSHFPPPNVLSSTMECDKWW